MFPSRVRLVSAPLSVLAAALLSFALAVVGTAADRWPLPRSHDEFSYILAAETFASGQLAKPPYPLPQAIETFHVLQQPTYASKYLPGHSLFLALGIALGGGPRLGQWLAFAFMGAAVCWMLGGWLSRRAAMVTTALFVLLLADTEWASGYWGSSVAVGGSALIFGAIRRLKTGPAIRLGVLSGLGAVLLALTRPAEGLAVSVLPACYIAWWLLSARDWRQRLVRVGLPCIGVLAVGAVLLGVHNKAVTGSALRLPYAHYEQNEPGAPPFIWQPVKAAQGHLRVTEEVRLRADIGSHSRMRNHWWDAMSSRAKYETLNYYFPDPLFAAVFLLVPFALRARQSWLVTGSAAAVGVVAGVSSFFQAHYLGPALPPLLVLYALGCGVAVRLRWSEHRIGRATIAGLSITLGALGVWQLFSHSPVERTTTLPEYWTRERAAIAQKLDSIPGKDVVFVRYEPTYRSLNEWVQNGADLANSELLWAHDLGESTNNALRQLEADRTAWLLTVRGRGRRAELTRYDDLMDPSRTLALRDAYRVERPRRLD